MLEGGQCIVCGADGKESLLGEGMKGKEVINSSAYLRKAERRGLLTSEERKRLENRFLV